MTPEHMRTAWQASLAISAVGGFIVATVHFCAMRSFQRSGHRGEHSYPEHRPAIMGPYLLFAAPATLFCLILPCAILVTMLIECKPLTSPTSAPLMICSVIVGGLGFLRVVLVVFNRRFQAIRDLLSKPLADLDPPAHVLPEALEISFVGQYGFYSIIVVTLWIFALTGQSDPLLIYIQLVLLFVADDWNIIAGYVSSTRGRVRTLDKARIVVTNLLLTALLAIAAVRSIRPVSPLLLLGLVFSLFFGAAYWFGMMKNFLVRGGNDSHSEQS
ncbi:MAG: hypothetical protein AAGJ40_20415 [Planctomycetota bacterium]